MNPLSVLGPDQQISILHTGATGIKIIIDGDRTRPTGKTTLCDYLKSQGADAVEAWELEEKRVKDNEPTNRICVLVMLDHPILPYQSISSSPQC